MELTHNEKLIVSNELKNKIFEELKKLKVSDDSINAVWMLTARKFRNHYVNGYQAGFKRGLIYAGSIKKTGD